MMQALGRWLKGFVRPPKRERLDLGRRALIGSSVVGVSTGLIFAIHPQSRGRAFHPALIRPPGSLPEPEFLSKCIRCGECMKVCPTNAIHPAWMEGGLEGLWSPVLKMNIGSCEYECTLCMQVCPTDAIVEMTVEEKQQVKIGLAYFDKNRCLPYAYARSCIVCEEHCPTPEKAIWFQEVEVTNLQGERVIVKQPHVDPELCIGCGICEAKCPIRDQAAVRVSSAGESRNPGNEIMLDAADSPY
jgi:formate hydrogenlyase subunit 6/NADH:ubiquinone oxidoreductase subunit I